MKAKQLQIPNACSERWDQMSKQENGRYCSSCSTVVRDFSRMSDTQIQHVLDKSNGKVCGRMSASQLNRPLNETNYRSTPDLLAVVLGMTLLMSTYPVYGQEETRRTPEISLIEKVEQDTLIVDLGHEYIAMRFQLVDEETGEPVPFVKSKVVGQDNVMFAGAYSDFDGYVNFKLSPDQFLGADSLVLSALDYGNVSISWDLQWSKDQTQIIPLSSDELLIQGDLIMIGAIVELTTAGPARNSRKYKRDMRKMKRKSRREED